MKTLPSRFLILLALLGGPTASQAQFAANVVRTEVQGIDLILYRTGVRDVVTLRGSLPAGDAFAAGTNPALATLTGLMLDKGTVTKDKFEISRQLEAVGATIGFAVEAQTAEVNAKCLRQDVPLVVGLLAEQLRTPRFDPEEFAKVKTQFLGALQRALDDPDERAEESFALAAYPPGHPNRPTPTDEMMAAVQAATLGEVKEFHARHYGPAFMKLVGVGDIDPATLPAEIERAFAGWSGGVAPQHDTPAGTDRPREQVVFMPDKTSVTILLGQPTGLKYSDRDAIVLRLATGILGSGFTSRLVGQVRDTEGLTYRINASMANDTFTGGDWKIYASFAPALLEKGVASTRRHLGAWYHDGVTDKEVADRQTAMVGQFKVNLATSDGLASMLLATANRGFPIGWLDNYATLVGSITPAEVNAAIKRHLNPEDMVLIQAGTVPGAKPEAK